MTIGNFGQYSVVSYQHELRNERVNLGVLVWHPILGRASRFAKNLGRVRAIDESAELKEVQAELDEIQRTVGEWSKEVESPLEYVATKFRHRVIVTSPMNARIQDPKAMLERLYGFLMAPEPITRASTNTQFSRSFSSRISHVLQKHNRTIHEINYIETDTFKPVSVAIWYQGSNNDYVWRTISLASLNRVPNQLTAVKAMHAENSDLRTLPKYENSDLHIAVQPPKPANREGLNEVLDWLDRTSKSITLFEDKDSIDAKVEELVSIK